MKKAILSVLKWAAISLGILILLLALLAGLGFWRLHRLHNKIARSHDMSDQSALIQGLLEGDSEKISQGLSKEAVNTPSKNGTAPILLAADRTNVNVVRALLKAGAAPDAATKDTQWTALHIAAEAGNADMVEVLLQGGASIEKTNSVGETPLLLAIESKNTAAVRVLVKHGANVDSPGKWGIPPLFAAIALRDEEQVKLLLEAGANPLAKDDDEVSCLARAQAEAALPLANFRDAADHERVQRIAAMIEAAVAKQKGKERP